MSTTFNFLSGSTLDVSSKFLFDALQSGKVYLGFARGEKTVDNLIPPPNVQWGVNSLISVEYRNKPNFSDIVGTEGDSVSDNKYFDTNSLRNPSISGADNTVSIYAVPVSATTLVGLAPIYTGLTLNFVGENWMMIEGLPQDYFTVISKSDSVNYYIINNSASGFDIGAKILTKSFTNVPFYSTECTLYSKSTSGVILNGIQRISNIIGESYVVGLHDPASILEGDVDQLFQSPSVSGTANKTTLINDTFELKDSSGNTLIDNMTFVSPNNTAAEIYHEVISPEGDLGNVTKYISFRYNYVNSEGQYIKFIISNRQVDELGIWNEHLPYDSVIPSSDANPPGLEVSFLKNPLIANSIFDVKGLINVPVSGIYFIKEMLSTTDVTLYTTPVSVGGYGFEQELIELNGSGIEHIGSVKTLTSFGVSSIPMNNYHNFVVGDTFYLTDPITIKYTVDSVSYEIDNSYINLTTILSNEVKANDIIVSEPTTAAARITIVKTQDIKKALQYGFYSALVNSDVDLTGINSPTEDVYRQLFLCYNPSASAGTPMTELVYKAPTYEQDEIFNKTTKQYDLGTVFYISNKIPIYRKFANSTSGKEEFKIII